MDQLANLHIECDCTRVLVAAFSGFILGGLWYSPVMFLNQWKKAANNPNMGEESGHSPWVFVFALMMNLMTASAMEHFLPAGATMIEAVRTALMLSIFFVFSSFGVTYSFSDKNMLLLLIDSLYHVVKMVIFAIILVGLK
jgi:hypothetical protein